MRLRTLDAETVVVTADHQELLGEFGVCTGYRTSGTNASARAETSRVFDPGSGTRLGGSVCDAIASGT
jgi:hypothetical protein